VAPTVFRRFLDFGKFVDAWIPSLLEQVWVDSSLRNLWCVVHWLRRRTFSATKWPGGEANRSSTASVEVKSEWCSTFALRYSSMSYTQTCLTFTCTLQNETHFSNVPSSLNSVAPNYRGPAVRKQPGVRICIYVFVFLGNIIFCRLTLSDQAWVNLQLVASPSDME
jgi:hypothetical protein